MSGTSKLPLLRKALRDLRNPLIAYGGGLAALGIMYVGLFPSYQDMLSSFELPSEYSAFFGDITNLSTLSAFIQIEFFSLWLPLLLAIFAIVSGTSQIAGDEQAGRLEVILSQPISRRRLFAERGGALLIGAVLICLACSLGFLVAWPLFVENADVSLGRALLAPLGLVGFGWFFVALALFTGALTATRGQATAIMTAFTVLTYLADVLRDLVPGLGPLRFVSPFFYGDTKRMFTDGAIPWHQAALFLGVAIVLLAALRTFEAREIGTERSPMRWRPRRSSRGGRATREASRPAEQPRA